MSRASHGKTLLIAGAVALVALLIVTEIWLPGLAEKSLTEGISRSLPEARRVRVDLKSTPSFMLLLGRIGRISLEAREFSIQDLKVAALQMDGRRVVIDPRSLTGAAGGKLRIKSADTLNATLLLTEQALNEYFWIKVDPAQLFRIKLEREQVSLAGELRVLSTEIDVDLAGDFVRRGPSEIAFVPSSLSIEKAQIPSFLLDAVADKFVLQLDLSDLPIPMMVEDIRIDPGKLYIYWARSNMGGSQ